MYKIILFVRFQFDNISNKNVKYDFLEALHGESEVSGLLAKWSSLDLLTEDDGECIPLSTFSSKGKFK